MPDCRKADEVLYAAASSIGIVQLPSQISILLPGVFHSPGLTDHDNFDLARIR